MKSDSERLMLKATEDSTKAHAYAIEAKSVIDERKRKVVEIEKLTDYHIVLCFVFVFCFWL